LAKKKPKVLSLFSGCGGLDLGFQWAGYNVVAANEFWQPAIDTYKLNFPKTVMFEGDIRDVKLELANNYESGFFDVVAGGFPCQPFSIAGMRNPLDPRGRLYEEFIEVIKYFKPSVFLMENVKGIISMKHFAPWVAISTIEHLCNEIARYKELHLKWIHRSSKNIEDLDENEEREHSELAAKYTSNMRLLESYLIKVPRILMYHIDRLGEYNAVHKILNAADFGVPQIRERFILIGAKAERDKINSFFPMPTHNDVAGQKTLDGLLQSEKLLSWVTAKESIDDLKDREEDVDFSHIFMKIGKMRHDELVNLKEGESLYGSYKESWRKLYADKPAFVQKENHAGVSIHYSLPRPITPREMARLQGFPDTFLFANLEKNRKNKSNILKQIGNAVPPLFGQVIAQSIKEHYFQQ
jgi:site-specific DNA-cytosine methylase